MLTHILSRGKIFATAIIMRRFVKDLESSLSIEKLSEVSYSTVFNRIFYDPSVAQISVNNFWVKSVDFNFLAENIVWF